ncbi:polysaccharide deacetylase family protein [Pseudonocardia sp. TRM90224]|uniref:polysaccharide deacetylase family protein n=1 Tax=Pseudonocardia sp. TRM90224 TaxID=2812678 RepID=UPI001E593498|nr:polysaccharide deacetylase family protein [Pseudonocardia sp. TRM90224]
MSWSRAVAAAAAASVAVVLAGCATATPSSTTVEIAPPPNPAEVRANELGLIPVLMYHRLVEKPVSVYDRTPADFRAELQRLAGEGYVPITVADLSIGRIDIPAGKHPVALTFDDGDPTTITLGPDGTPAPGTAVRILMDVAAANPGFPAVASMYVNAAPFGGGEGGTRALRWLHDNGFEVGNHTFGHINLRTAPAERARQDIVRGDGLIREALPGYAPSTLALPFGARPRDTQLAARGEGYNYTGVLLVGSNPTDSPYSADFEPSGIPRIRSQGADGTDAAFGSTTWLDKLAAQPQSRYTSDGNPATVSYPARTGTPSPQLDTPVVAYEPLP